MSPVFRPELTYRARSAPANRLAGRRELGQYYKNEVAELEGGRGDELNAEHAEAAESAGSRIGRGPDLRSGLTLYERTHRQEPFETTSAPWLLPMRSFAQRTHRKARRPILLPSAVSAPSAFDPSLRP